MPNKKTLKRNKRNSKRSRGRNRKGGFFGLFEDKHNETDTDRNIHMHVPCCGRHFGSRIRLLQR